MDCINLTGIRSYGYIGYLPEEKILGQWFEVDLKLWMDLSQAAVTDNIHHTVDYRSVIDLVQNLVKTSSFDLLERLAGAIASEILQYNDIISQVQVTVIKPTAPIPDFTGRISVQITLSGNHFMGNS
ncbi:dihydroneopterin aldolase [Cylindrospermopsis raciborskii]|uniref:7,8-dihydroneopterin aldolase n=1 Tax=Cylindrospermopsis raciborskii CENA302 TaxID=1170768 RepID=A0A9Q5QWV8_9CYAN|nr:dihydroneopterin aldolase [Cylindrospermopsis raciborskii]NLQ04130.1 dihydroneopterin aldolase [Cylindrospermopsis raciborskii MVCC19]OHY35208.1 dihydroneopterin aldolase [Cylindrospermopsis raciborskii MVCC14]OPH09692.1 dihydroneopterin aldolase [Cylindrospermopsis raciborskii CENA302]